MNAYRLTTRQLLGALASAPLLLIGTLADADVTESKTMTMDMGIAKVTSTITERISGDKQRTDTDAHCDGFLLSMICGDLRGGEIVRLDKNLSWRLEPKHKSYVETPLPTPAQIAELKERRAELLEKLKSCPPPAGRPAPDTAKCDLSPPQFDVQDTGETATIAGHSARHSSITMKQTCANKESGDACEYVVRIDAWMTEDRIAGLDEERAFRTAYDRKMGLDEATMTSIAPQLQRFMAPYAAAMKKVGAKAQDLRGIPLRTTISVSVGGAHCAAARQHQESGGVTANAGHAAQAAAENSTTAATGAAAEQAVSHSTGGSLVGSIAGSAAGAFGRSLLGGMFAKKSPPPKPAPPGGAADTAPLFSITTETTEIRSDSIPGDQFELPTGWTLRQPKPAAERPEFSCPAAGA
ncbi:MAG: hypothetical protein KGL92_11665 [Gammaproteobacteria bacterium]|nr:hypothetical protein [Gammaproteobacteria bacterium]